MAILAVTGPPSIAKAAPIPLIISADPWCPYNCDDSSRERGFMVDIVSEILARHDYVVTYRNDPWPKALEDVASGKVDAVVGAGDSEAKDLITAPEPLGINKTCFFTLAAKDWSYSGVPKLASVRLGVISGYLYGGAVDQYVDENRIRFDKVQLVSGDRPLLQNVRKLQSGRIDVLAENEMVMSFSMRKFAILGIRSAGCDPEIPLYVAFSPKRSDAKRLSEYINVGVSELRRSGGLRKILDRYGVKDWR